MVYRLVYRWLVGLIYYSKGSPDTFNRLDTKVESQIQHSEKPADPVADLVAFVPTAVRQAP
jgi:hypothetical protein